MNTTAHNGSRAEDFTVLLDLAPKPDDHDGVREFIHAMADLDLAVLLIRPGMKLPFDGRSRAQQRAKTPGGVYLASNDHAVLDGYLNAYIKSFGKSCEVNLAVAVGASRLVVVDCDTRSQTEAFLADAELDPDTLPTVRSPGQRDHDGQMVHSNGGHYWFTVPDDVELPEGASFTDTDGGYAVMYGAKYVLIPPSVRPEGPYTLAGRVEVLSEWLRDRIIDRAPEQRKVADRSTASADTPIDEWSRSIGWDEILPADWTPTGLVDSCGCPTWTAPWLRGNPKSATGHEPGCGASHFNADNPPLHIWTDHPGEPFEGYTARTGKTTLSKLQTAALLHFNDEMGKAMDALGLIPDPVTLGGSEGEHAQSGSVSGGRRIRLRPVSEIKDDVPTWAWSYDGAGRIMRGTLVIFAGRPAAGKSTAARWFASELSRGTLEGCFFGKPQTVAYISTEEDWEHLVTPSLRAHGADLTRVQQVIVEKGDREMRLLAADDEHALTDLLISEGVTAVIVDPLMSTINGKSDINKNNEVREALEPWARIAQALNGVVIGVAHLVKTPANGNVLAAIQGSSAFGEVARAALGFAKDEDSDMRVMSQVKNSAGREDLSLEYRIVETEVVTSTGKKAGVARFEITGTSEVSVGDMMRDQRGGGGASVRVELAAWLGKYLAGGPRWASQGYEDAAGAGFSEDQVKKGRKACGVESIKAKGDGRWYWATAEQADSNEMPADDFSVTVIG